MRMGAWGKGHGTWDMDEGRGRGRDDWHGY